MFKWASLFNRDEFERDIESLNGRVKCRVCLENGKINYSVYRDNKIVIKHGQQLLCTTPARRAAEREG